jgi:hypothetical protein
MREEETLQGYFVMTVSANGIRIEAHPIVFEDASSVHQMVLGLESKGLIARTPGKARSIRLLIDRAELPDLE